ncbi:MAG: hypothetical protein M1822_008931 [Bathelium mastoideum]|nr:MAG: hypothetical protein M1822_008931 [Bathelium mastoideum]
MLRVAGDNIAIITSTTDAEYIYNDPISFAFDFFIDMVYRSCGGLSEGAFPILWRTPKDGFTSLWPNPKEHPVVHTGNALLHKQLLQPDALYDLSEKVMTYIEEKLRWNTFFPSSVLAAQADEKVLSLHCWCRDVTIDAQSRCFFGNYIDTLEPNLTAIFDKWDINSWMMTYQLPPPFNTPASRPREQLVKVFTRYLDAPREKRRGGVVFTDELEDECVNAGLSHEDISRVLFIIMWGINSNVQMTTFWMMAHIVARPQLLAAIREEITLWMTQLPTDEAQLPAAMANTTRQHLTLPANCPLFNSTYSEVLRLCSTGAVVRKVMKPDAHISGKHIPQGTKMLIPQRQFLLSPNGFGSDVADFDPERFMKKRNLDRSEYYRPFGGGITLCSGRVVGKMEVMAFTALALWRYDLTVVQKGEKGQGVKGMAFPRLDEAKPSLGVAKQVEGDDMIVKLRRRNI